MGYINPLMRLPAAKKLMAMPADQRAPLEQLLRELRADADREAENAWKRRKGPMAAYWRAVSTYARHVAHMLAQGVNGARGGRVAAVRCGGHDWIHREEGEPWLMCAGCGALYEDVPESER